MNLFQYLTYLSSGNGGVFCDVDAIVKVGPVFTLYHGGGGSL